MGRWLCQGLHGTDDRQHCISKENVNEKIIEQDPDEVVERYIIAISIAGRFLEIWKDISIDPALELCK